MPPIAQAQPEINNLYAPTLQQIQAQVPAIQQLYGSLLQGLQGQAQNQVGNVVASAAQRGVSGYGVTQGAQDTLGQALALQAGQLGVQQAQDVTGIQGALGKAQIGRAQAVNDLANSLQAQQNESTQNQQKLTSIERNAQLQQLQDQRQYNVSQARAAASAAKAQSQMDLTTVGEGTIARQLRLGLNSVKGKDGHVSPESLAKAYSIWQQAGLTPDAFWKNFQGLWNPKQGNYGDQFHYFLTKG